jgi:hypothetical protein
MMAWREVYRSAGRAPRIGEQVVHATAFHLARFLKVGPAEVRRSADIALSADEQSLLLAEVEQYDAQLGAGAVSLDQQEEDTAGPDEPAPAERRRIAFEEVVHSCEALWSALSSGAWLDIELPAPPAIYTCAPTDTTLHLRGVAIPKDGGGRPELPPVRFQII